MSFNSMLKHRANVKRLQESADEGHMPITRYVNVLTGVRCFLDLNFIRKGRDPMWTPETGNSEDRSGVLFVKSTVPLEPGDRITITRGPLGTFELQGAIDQAYTPNRNHHLEIYVAEVAKAFTGGGA